MNFIVSSTALYSHLQAISRVINSKNPLPILDCFLFQLEGIDLTVTASDGETTMITSLQMAENDGDGRFAISAKNLLESLKELPEQPLTFNINLDTYETIVYYQNGKYSFMAYNADEYPQPVELSPESIKIDIDAGFLLKAISRTIFATTEDELRPVMNGIYFDITTEDLTIVASDGHKLVRNKTTATKGEEKAAFIFPKKPATLIKNILPKEIGNIHIAFDDKNAYFTLSNYRMICRLIEGKYPNYNSVIPVGNPYKITIDRQQMGSALRRVGVFSSQENSLVKLQVEENQITVSTQDIDFSTSAEETISCHYEGEPMSIGFKSPFLVELLSNIAAEEIIIELADPSRAGVIVPFMQEENEELLMLLMPMMLNY